MTDVEVIRAWFNARLDADEQVAQEAGPARLEPGSDLFVQDDDRYHDTIVVTQRRVLGDIAATRAILAALPADLGGYDGDRVTFGNWSSCSDSCSVDILVHVLRLLAQRWADREDMPEELKLT